MTFGLVKSCEIPIVLIYFFCPLHLFIMSHTARYRYSSTWHKHIHWRAILSKKKKKKIRRSTNTVEWSLNSDIMILSVVLFTNITFMRCFLHWKCEQTRTQTSYIHSESAEKIWTETKIKKNVIVHMRVLHIRFLAYAIHIVLWTRMNVLVLVS